MLGVSCNGDQGFSGDLKQQAIDHRLVVIRNVADGSRQREDNMVVIHRQQIGLTCFEPALGSMGLAFPIALGVAIAQPKRRVIGLEGDGSLLMQLGCLSTIAQRAPKNLSLIVFDNGVYQITGAQPTPAAGVADIVSIARASGLAATAWAADEDDFERLVEAALAAAAPSLIAVKIDTKPAAGMTNRDPVQIRERFMRGLGVR